MNKKTYLNNLYPLYQYPNKPPVLQYQDFTLQLTPEGTIHLTTFSREFDSFANLFETVEYWKDSHYDYADTLIGIEIANAISEVMLYSGVRLPYFMTIPYYDFINASLAYYNSDSHFWMDYYSNKYLNPYPAEYTASDEYIDPLKQLGISTELTLPLTFSKCNNGYFMALSFSDDRF